MVKSSIRIGDVAFWRTAAGDLIMGHIEGEAMQPGPDGESRLAELVTTFFSREF